MSTLFRASSLAVDNSVVVFQKKGLFLKSPGKFVLPPDGKPSIGSKVVFFSRKLRHFEIRMILNLEPIAQVCQKLVSQNQRETSTPFG